MTKCSYCGAEYPDDAVRCAVDQRPLGRLGEATEADGVGGLGALVLMAKILGVVLGAVCLLFAGILVLVWAFDVDRSRDFRQKIREATPLVRAIEKFRTDTGSYPQSLDELGPKYLTGIATNAGGLRQKFGGWTYYTDTNAGKVSYTLRNYNMGHAGIDYTPPYWTGNVDGNTRVLRKGL